MDAAAYDVKRIESLLNLQINRLQAPDILKEAMNYSLQAGGKRIRPLLLLSTVAALGKPAEKGLQTACALEMLHTYSLIHDDLPAMDDDDLRRGKPTNHKVFGEAMAILAGDGLLTYSFQLIAEDPGLADATKIKLIAMLAKAAGPEGMVAGQVADMEGENKRLSLEELQYIHANKTGKLLIFSVLAGAVIGGAKEAQLECFRKFASHLGLAFQIRDDILDIEGDQEKIGKTVGSDESHHKSTYPSLLTLEGAKRELQRHIRTAKEQLLETGANTKLLLELSDMVGMRDH
ncbi:polyprenyl synthetase family protein [Heyndrickxia acidiproducens]|uniref:polyprenyl synthetase family protein n=1 Tax=Heyndrickxia acidiproducens TaxID=1121084 RepID=UPI0003809A94|nr:farnesyl diphosphate synthase [Heyndrickxia acidiproducens]